MWITVVQPLLAQCYKSLSITSGTRTHHVFGSSTGESLLIMRQPVYIPLKDSEVFALQQIS
jgi:hypothetical protein